MKHLTANKKHRCSFFETLKKMTLSNIQQAGRAHFHRVASDFISAALWSARGRTRPLGALPAPRGTAGPIRRVRRQTEQRGARRLVASGPLVPGKRCRCPCRELRPGPDSVQTVPVRPPDRVPRPSHQLFMGLQGTRQALDVPQAVCSLTTGAGCSGGCVFTDDRRWMFWRLYVH